MKNRKTVAEVFALMALMAVMILSARHLNTSAGQENMEQASEYMDDGDAEGNVLDDYQNEVLGEISELVGSMYSDSDVIESVRYVVSQPYSFIMYVNPYPPYGNFSYRNIDAADPVNEIDDTCSYKAYIADAVLDRYIREYGGEDTEYYIRTIPQSEYRPTTCGENCFYVEEFEIYNADTKITVTHPTTDMYGMLGVRIENKDQTLHLVDFQRLFSYYQTMYLSGYLDETPHKKKYWMIINPRHADEDPCYRNVDAENINAENVEIGIDWKLNKSEVLLGIFLADQAIDQYIRKYAGSTGDVMYQVCFFEKTVNEFYMNTYVLYLKSGEDSLRVQYSDDSWIVSVEVPDKEYGR